jgi:hypothetical protein
MVNYFIRLLDKFNPILTLMKLIEKSLAIHFKTIFLLYQELFIKPLEKSLGLIKLHA